MRKECRLVFISFLAIAACHRASAPIPSDTPAASETPSAPASANEGANPSATPSTPPTPAAGPFEGEIELDVGTFGVRVSNKASRERVQMLDHGNDVGGALLVDRASMKLLTLSASGKEYSELDMTSLKPKTSLIAVQSNKTAVVAGHACQILTVADGAAHREICLARDLPPLAIDIGPTSDGQGYQPSFGAGFPLRIEIYDASNKVIAKMEATRIEPKPISDSELAPPPGAKKIASP